MYGPLNNIIGLVAWAILGYRSQPGASRFDSYSNKLDINWCEIYFYAQTEIIFHLKC